jgi:Flp pilus assembly protein TadG
MIKLRSLHRDQRGAAAIEAAIAMPVLVVMIYGIFATGQLFEANAGMEHALGEGARYATLCSSLSVSGNATTCSVHTGTEIKAYVNNKLFGANNGNGTWDDPNLDTSTAVSGYVTLTVTYHPLMKFAFYTLPSFTVTRSKRIYLADTPGTSAQCTAGTSTKGSCAIYN